MADRLPQDMWLEAQQLLDRAQEIAGHPGQAEKRAMIEADMRANPAILPYFIEAMKRQIREAGGDPES
jgi:hypothetical protein